MWENCRVAPLGRSRPPGRLPESRENLSLEALLPGDWCQELCSYRRCPSQGTLWANRFSERGGCTMLALPPPILPDAGPHFHCVWPSICRSLAVSRPPTRLGKWWRREESTAGRGTGRRIRSESGGRGGGEGHVSGPGRGKAGQGAGCGPGGPPHISPTSLHPP